MLPSFFLLLENGLIVHLEPFVHDTLLPNINALDNLAQFLLFFRYPPQHRSESRAVTAIPR